MGQKLKTYVLCYFKVLKKKWDFVWKKNKGENFVQIK